MAIQHQSLTPAAFPANKIYNNIKKFIFKGKQKKSAILILRIARLRLRLRLRKTRGTFRISL
jgi:hypothetical protein